jgi:hypothetical protein
MPKDKSPALSAVLVSYVPYLVGAAGQRIPIDDFKQFAKFLDEMPSGQASACLWFKKDFKSDEDYKISPVFLYDDANGLVDHFTAWSENKPVDWFSLHLRQKHNKYVFALIPRFIKSVERYQIAYQLQTGYPLPKDTKFSMIFRALHFVSGSENLFNVERHRLSDPLEIGFLDASKIDMNNTKESLEKLDAEEIRWVGPFPLAPNKDVLSLLDSILDDAKEPSRASFKA